MDQIAAIRAQCEAGRTFTKQVLGATFTLTLPPHGEIVDRVWSVVDPNARRKALAEILLEALTEWDGVVVGMFVLSDDQAPVPLPADRSKLGAEDDPAVVLFRERTDIMADLLDALTEKLIERGKRIGDERKNFGGTSTPS